jgi:replicative DNA helicase
MGKETIGRIPPQNLDAEQSVLGSMMIDRVALERGLETLAPAMFYRDAHAVIFKALRGLVKQNSPVDIVSLQEILRKNNRLEVAGGTEYLMALLDAVPSAANIDYYAGIVAEKYKARRIIEQCSATVAALYKGEDPDVALSRHVSQALDLDRAHSGVQIEHVQGWIEKAYNWAEERNNNPGAVTGIPTGIGRLDRMTGGYQLGQLIVKAARPSMGKTAGMLQDAMFAALKGFPTVIFSLETSKLRLAIRMLARAAGVNMGAMRKGRLYEDDWGRMARALPLFDESRLPLYISDDDLHANSIPLVARRCVQQLGMKFMCVDYLSLIQSDKKETREQEVGAVTKMLHRTAINLNIAVEVLAQLNRVVEQGKDARPQLHHLRESGQIEAESDLVIGIYNPKLEDDPDSPLERDAEYIVMKQKDGATGTVPLTWNPTTQTFRDRNSREEPTPWWAE